MLKCSLNAVLLIVIGTQCRKQVLVSQKSRQFVSTVSICSSSLLG